MVNCNLNHSELSGWGAGDDDDDDDDVKWGELIANPDTVSVCIKR